MKRSIIIALLFSALLALPTGCGQKTNQAACPLNPRGGLSVSIEPVKSVTILESSRNYFWAPVYLADTLGYYEAEGLDVTFLPMNETLDVAGSASDGTLVLSDLETVITTGDQKIVLSTSQRGSLRCTEDWLRTGAGNLSELTTVNPESTRYEGFVVAVPEDLLETDPDVIQKAVNAIARSMEWMGEKSPEEIADQLAGFFPGEEAALLAAAQYDKTHEISSQTGRHTHKGYAAAVDASASDECPEERAIYEESFLNQARDQLNATQLCRKHGAA